MFLALCSRVVWRQLARHCINVGLGIQTWKRAGQDSPILMMEWSVRNSHMVQAFFSEHSYLKWLISRLFGGCVCVQMSRCFCRLSDQQSAVRPWGTTCSLRWGAISHWCNDICHHFHTSSCPDFIFKLYSKWMPKFPKIDRPNFNSSTLVIILVQCFRVE